MIQRVVIDVDGPQRDAPPDAARPAPLHAVRRHHLRRRVGRRRVDARTARTWRSSRRRATTSTKSLRVADAATGAVRDVFAGVGHAVFESGNGKVNWHVLPATNEVIWFSERDDWGHLYLYDLDDRPAEEPDHDGRRATCSQVLRVDREGAHDLVHRRRAARRAGIRTSGTSTASASTARHLRSLTPEDADHDVLALARRPVLRRQRTRGPTCRR